MKYTDGYWQDVKRVLPHIRNLAALTGKTVLLTGWTDIWGKFDAEDNIEFVEDVNDLEFDNETGSMVIDQSDGDLEINYYDT